MQWQYINWLDLEELDLDSDPTISSQDNADDNDNDNNDNDDEVVNGPWALARIDMAKTVCE